MDTTTKLAVDVTNGNPAERILVIAPNHHRFRDWCRDYDVNPHSPNVRCVTREHDLRGYSDAWYALIDFPPGLEGVCIFHVLNRLKVTRGFKNAEVIPEPAP